MVTFS